MTQTSIYIMRWIKQVDINEDNVHEGEGTTVTQGMHNELFCEIKCSHFFNDVAPL